MYCVQSVEFGGELYDRMIDLRRRVLRRPLGLDFTTEDLERERDDRFCCAVAQNGSVVGCLLLSSNGPRSRRMRQVAVEPLLQGKGIGRILVLYSEEICRSLEIETIVLHARLNVVPFYKRLGYNVVGEEFEEVSIPHLRMIKELGPVMRSVENETAVERRKE